MKRLPYLMLMLFLALVVVTRSAPLGAVVVQSWHYDAATGTNPSKLTIILANMSNKDVMAFSLTDDIAYADGKHDIGERSQDLLGSQETFAPGTTRSIELVGVLQVLSVSAVSDVVIYGDRTADVNNDRAFQRLLKNRKERLLAIQKANEVIKQFPPNSNEAVAQELERLAALSSVRSSSDPVPSGGVLRGLAIEVRQRKDLDQLVKDNDDRIALVSANINVTKGSQQ